MALSCAMPVTYPSAPPKPTLSSFIDLYEHIAIKLEEPMCEYDDVINSQPDNADVHVKDIVIKLEEDENAREVHELTRWIKRHPSHWSKDEVLDWVYFVVERMELDGSRVRGEAYQAITGSKLCRMTREDFEATDPVYGSKLFDYFRDLVKDATIREPKSIDRSCSTTLEALNQPQRFKQRDTNQALGSFSLSFNISNNSSTTSCSISNNNSNIYTKSRKSVGSLGSSQQRNIQNNNNNSSDLVIYDHGNDVTVDLGSLGVYPISTDFEFPSSRTDEALPSPGSPNAPTSSSPESSFSSSSSSSSSPSSSLAAAVASSSLSSSPPLSLSSFSTVFSHTSSDNTTSSKQILQHQQQQQNQRPRAHPYFNNQHQQQHQKQLLHQQQQQQQQLHQHLHAPHSQYQGSQQPSLPPTSTLPQLSPLIPTISHSHQNPYLHEFTTEQYSVASLLPSSSSSSLPSTSPSPSPSPLTSSSTSSSSTFCSTPNFLLPPSSTPISSTPGAPSTTGNPSSMNVEMSASPVTILSLSSLTTSSSLSSFTVPLTSSSSSLSTTVVDISSSDLMEVTDSDYISDDDLFAPCPISSDQDVTILSAIPNGSHHMEKKRTGRKNKSGQGNKGNHLWEFVRDLLQDPSCNPRLLKWEDKENGVFRFVQSEAVAQLWGEKKKNPMMTYEKLSRAMRFCRTSGYFDNVPKNGKFPKKLCFMFGAKAHGWRD